MDWLLFIGGIIAGIVLTVSAVLAYLWHELKDYGW